MSPYLRTVKTSSGATAVQIVHSSHRGSRDIEHIGSAHDDAGLELLKAAARQRLAAGQDVLDLGLDAGAPGGPLPIISSSMGCLAGVLSRGYRVLGFDQATAGDEVFFQLVLARIIEPVSKLDSLRVLEEAGVTPALYRTVTRRLRAFAEDSWRQQISAACAAHAGLGPASLVLYDCSQLPPGQLVTLVTLTRIHSIRCHHSQCPSRRTSARRVGLETPFTRTVPRPAQ